MSKAKLPPDVIEARAEAARNAVRTRRVLREYAGKLHTISERLWALAAVISSRGADSFAGSEALMLMRRRRVIAASVESFTRAASGMVEEAAMDRQFKAELLLRLREVEEALDAAREAAKACHEQSPKVFPAKLLEDVGLPQLKTVRYAVG